MNVQLVRDPIWTGDDLFTTVPSPSWPEVFCPQPQSVPVVFTAIVWDAPQETSDQFVSVPTWTGAPVVVVPICPPEFEPHPHRVPLVINPKENCLPAEMFPHVASVPICTGELLALNPPPSWPCDPCPQDHIVPLDFNAIVCDPPHATLDQFVSVPTCTGELLRTTSPRPSCPFEFPPQLQRVPFVFIPHACVMPVDIEDQLFSDARVGITGLLRPS